MILQHLKPLFAILPQVKTPIHRQDFREKLKWTAIILVLYFFLTIIPLYGLSKGSVDQFAQLRAVMAGTFGSILTLGIGPIVTSSIVLQLLVGAKILKLDLSKHEDKALFQGTQKILAIVMTVFEAGVLVFTGSLMPDPAIQSAVWLLLIQLIIGALLIIYLDEVVSKWGFGSGVGLFIAAGVSQSIIVGMFNFLPDPVKGGGVLSGAIPEVIRSFAAGAPNFAVLFPIIATIAVFLVAAYGESMRVEIPISHGHVKRHGRIRGSVGKYPLKFIYASNMPVILTSALLVNVSLIASVFQKIGFPILGQVDQGRAINGLAYMLTTPNISEILSNPIKVLVYGVFFIGFCILFAWLWVEMTGLSAKNVSKQLYTSGIQIPGFRSSKQQLDKIMKKYIPALTVLGGVFVGLLAFGADLTSALGGGTGVLLTVGIVYKLYEEMAQEQLMDMHPMLRKFLGE